MPSSKNITKYVSRKVKKWDTASVRIFISENYPNIDTKEAQYLPSVSQRKKIIERSKIIGLLCHLHPNNIIPPVNAALVLNQMGQPCKECSRESKNAKRSEIAQTRFNNSLENLSQLLPNLDFNNYKYVQHIKGYATIENLICRFHPRDKVRPTTPGRLKRGSQPCTKCSERKKYRNKVGQRPPTSVEDLIGIQEYDLTDAEIIRRREGRSQYNKAYLVGIFCKEHNVSFEQRLDVFKKGQIGCSDCKSQKSSINEKLVRQYLQQESTMIELVKYAGSSRGESQWRCQNCGNEWLNQFDQIKSGYGCKKCADIKRIENAKMSEEDARNLISKNYGDELLLSHYGGSATSISQFK